MTHSLHSVPRLARPLMGLLLACLVLPATAAVYRWVDAQGVVNFSEQRPDGQAAEPVDLSTGAASASPSAENDTGAATGDLAEHTTNTGTPATGAAPGTGVVPGTGAASTAASAAGQEGFVADRDAALARLQAAERARQDELEHLRALNCERAHQVLENLSSRGRIRVRDADGDERALPEEERQAEIRTAQDDVVTYCDR